jgi:hypothetical protein
MKSENFFVFVLSLVTLSSSVSVSADVVAQYSSHAVLEAKMQKQEINIGRI